MLDVTIADGEYVFEVHSNNSTAKTPLGLYDDETIPNDAARVVDDLSAYYGGDDRD